MKHVLVIGGGFAGLMALKQLIKSKKLKLTLININDYFLFTPRLTELLNESISKKIVIKKIKDIFGNRVDFIKDKAVFVDFSKKIVKTAKNKVSYDYLVLTQGATTNFFGNENIERNTIDYKDYDAVLEMRDKIKNNLEKASKNFKKELLTFAVIGGGLTGIELICSLREAVIKGIKKYPNLSSKDAKFILIQGDKTIMPQFNDKAKFRIEKLLIKNKIEIMTGTNVRNVNNNTIILKDNKIKSSTIIWTAGIIANKVKTNPNLKLDQRDTIKVSSKLKIPKFSDVYAAGDAALFIENNKPLPATAQVAWQEGICIGKNILRRIKGKKEKDFYYSHKGTLIVLGSNNGIFTYKFITFDGKLAWYFRHLFYKFRFWQIT